MHANYAFFHYKLSSGWLFGRQVVSTFIQWDRMEQQSLCTAHPG